MPDILRPSVWPPGGYQYKQPETGMEFDGNHQLKAQILLILAHRKGNGLARATYDEVVQDLVQYTCQRVPGVCGSATPAAKLAVRPVRKCGACGGRKAA